MTYKRKRFYESHWVYLFHSLILLLVIFPYIDPQHPLQRPWAILAINSLLMLSIIYAVSPNRRFFLAGVILIFPGLIGFWRPEIPYQSETIIISTFFLYLYSLLMTIYYLLQSKEFSINQLFGATSVYILIGLLWTTMYQGIELFFPGSFFIEDVLNLDNNLSWSDFIYYSFTTLTTLGYGDITPVAPEARSLAIVEAVTGVIFVPVILSGIVSILISHSIKETVKD